MNPKFLYEFVKTKKGGVPANSAKCVGSTNISGIFFIH